MAKMFERLTDLCACGIGHADGFICAEETPRDGTGELGRAVN